MQKILYFINISVKCISWRIFNQNVDNQDLYRIFDKKFENSICWQIEDEIVENSYFFYLKDFRFNKYICKMYKLYNILGFKKKCDRHAYRQKDGQTYIQTDRQTCRQTDRQTDRH